MNTSEERVAYINAMIACANIEALGMAAANGHCLMFNEKLPYKRDDFLALLEKYGIHHNTVVSFLRGEF